MRHVVQTQGLFLGFVGLELGPIPSVDDDPVAACRTPLARRSSTSSTIPARCDRVPGLPGPTTFEAAVDRFLCVDQVVHGWDLAHATGLDERIDPDDVARVRKLADSYGDAMRSPQAFGPAVDPPPGADDQALLLAFLGRNPEARPPLM